MNTETIRHALRRHKTAVIAVETGLSIATIDAIKSGRNQYHTTRTVEKLLAFLEYHTNELPSISQKSAT